MQSTAIPGHTHYQLKAQESIPDSIKRIVSEQVNRAIWQLTDPPDGRDKGVHEARKCFKRIRAVLQLVHKKIGKKTFKQENVFYRDTSRHLAPVRESAVLIQTLDRLCQRFSNQLPPDAFGEFYQKLVAKHHTVSRQILDNEHDLAEVVTLLQTAQQRIDDWPITHNDFSALSGGLRRIYREGRRSLANVYATPNAENYHEWRKWVKHLWYHIRLLKPLHPTQLKPLISELDHLAELLGDAHDLAELRLIAQSQPKMFDNTDELQLLPDFADSWQRELELKARPLGRQIYAEKPEVFVNRMATYWQAWQSDRILEESVDPNFML